jgi:hypothetical protein
MRRIGVDVEHPSTASWQGAVCPDDEWTTLRRCALWALLVAKLVGAWGIGWDIRWHLIIGRDSFWIAPHVMAYASVVAGALIPLGVLVFETWGRRLGADRPLATTTVGPPRTRGFHLALWGMIITILAAPIDDLWHRLFGLDISIWSPPHLLGFAGFQVAHLGGILIALEVYGASWKRWVALIANGIFLLWTFQIVVDQSVQIAFRRGSIFLFTFPVLGALAFTFTLVLVGRIAESRSAPLAVAVGALMLAISILLVGDVGFAILQPTSVIDEVIAADPTSPLAVAHEMARRNGWVLGRSMLLRQILLAPAALMILTPVRRWRRTAAIFGLVLFVTSWAVFARVPAFSHISPTAIETAFAMVVALLCAIGAGWCAMRLADVFERVTHRLAAGSNLGVPQ